MTSRRRLLQIIASSFKWIAHSFTNLYYSLIPTTINDKKVQDKAKVVKVYGNSEVKNQLIVNSGIHQSYQSWTIDNSQGSSTLYATQRWDCPNDFRLNIGHKYLIWFVGTKTIVGSGLTRLYLNVANKQGSVFNFQTQNANIITINSIEAPNNVVNLNTLIGANITLTVDGYLCFTDLTQRFPFDTPTTLTDARVQKILNGGYEEYNLGEIVDVNMGEIDSEPYNLFDEVMESGRFNLTTGAKVNDATNLRTTNGIKLIGGQTYVFEMKNLLPSGGNVWAHLEDVNGNIIAKEEWSTYINISQSGNSRDLANSSYKTNRIFVPNKICILKFYTTQEYGTVYKNDICVYLLGDGSRTGYADHNDFVDLANFKPIDVMGIKDTFLANSVGYKITKKTFVVDLGTLNYVLDDYRVYTTDLQNLIKKEAGLMNIICSSFVAVSSLSQLTSNNSSMHVSSAGNVSFSNMGYNTTTFKQAMSDVLLYFELATYQTINFPLRHLGMAKIRDLSWSYNSDGAYLYATVDNIKLLTSDNTILNAYIGKYLSVNYNNFYSNPQNNTLSQSANSNLIRVKDNQYDNVTDFINAMGDEYIYFETADVVDETGIIIDKGNLSLSYQGSGVGTAHDTMEQNDTEWVFTKAMVDVDLGMQNFVQKDNGSWHFTAVEHSHNYNYTDLTNIVCSIGEQKSASTLEQKTQTELEAYGAFLYGYDGSYNGFRIFRSDLVNKTVEEVKTAMAGIILKYELAMPQVIRIPRKHLGVVKVKDLSWQYLSSSFGGSFKANVSDLKSSNAYSSIDNTYCQKFETVPRGKLSSYSFAVASQPKILFVRSVDCLNVNDFVAKYGNLIIFYETENEVADIDLTILVEAGGTLTSNWFSWVRNQLVQNGNFVDVSGWHSSGSTSSASNNTLTLTTTTKASWVAVYRTINIISGHKYLVKTQVKCSENTNYFRASLGNKPCSTIQLTANQSYNYSSIIEYDGSGSGYIYFYPNYSTGISEGATLEISNVQCFDLTLGFGAGKEPTDINGPVIKEILRLGYIPTDVSGTLTDVDSKVLPDIDCKIKCK